MWIRYGDGTQVEAIVLSRTGNRLRVAVNGCEDAAEFVCAANGTWISEQCEPVQIDFGAVRLPALDSASYREADFVCPPELAVRLLTELFPCDRAPEAEDEFAEMFEPPVSMPIVHRVM
jgi:hypothetical protein